MLLGYCDKPPSQGRTLGRQIPIRTESDAFTVLVPRPMRSTVTASAARY
jgi:hypothetical protein